VWYRYGRKKITKAASRADLDEQREALLKELTIDRNVSVVIGLTFLISCAIFTVRGAFKLKFWDTKEGHGALDADAQKVAEVLSWPTGALYSVVFVVRVFLARRFKSELMWRSAWSALASAIFASLVALLDVVQRKWQYSWRAEPICAFGLAALLFIEGMRTLVNNMYEPEDEVQRLLD
jgi:cytochrome bd-type quinol oxidase subunit 2